MRTISSGLMYQAVASRVNKFVSSVRKRLSSSCRDRWVSEFPAAIGGCLTSRDRWVSDFGWVSDLARYGNRGATSICDRYRDRVTSILIASQFPSLVASKNKISLTDALAADSCG
jgi:hypothetical protein